MQLIIGLWNKLLVEAFKMRAVSLIALPSNFFTRKHGQTFP